MNIWMCDIIDCSKAHVRSLEAPTAAGKRFILSQMDGTRYIELAKQVHDGLNEMGYNF